MNSCQTCNSIGKTPVTDALSGLPVAMAYVPWQTFHHTFDLCKALRVGTIFPDLCQPFCGKRGGC